MSPNLRNVVSFEEFGDLGEGNVGEFLKFVPGIQVSMAPAIPTDASIRGMPSGGTILKVDGLELASDNPSVRAAGFTSSNTANIDRVEITKVPTPDMPANAIAGYLNLISRRGFDRRGRRVDLTLGTRWTDLYSGKSPSKDPARLDLVTLNFSDVFGVFGGTRNLGVAFNVSHRSAPTLTDAVGGIGAAAAGAGHVLPTATNGLTTPLLRAMGSGETYAPTHKQNEIGRAHV